MRVLGAVGVEAESDLAFAGLHQLLRPVLSRLDSVPAVQADAVRIAMGLAPGVAENRFLIALGVLTLVTELADDTPVLCLVDDAQWLDRPTAEVLAFVARRLGAEGIGLLVAVRAGDAPSALGPGLPRRLVGGLDATAAERLVLDRFGGGIAPDVRRVIIEGAEGNPLALQEVPAELSQEQLDGTARLPRPLPLGHHLEEILLARVRRLPPAAQSFLLVAAAEGVGDARVVAAAAAALGIDAAAKVDAERAGVVRTDGRLLSFRHPILKQAVYDGASVRQRRDAHDALVGVLSGEANADRRTWHRAALVLGTDDELADELERTAERAGRRSGHAAGCRALIRAAELTSSAERRSRRLAAAARTALEAGLPSEAYSLLDAAETQVDPQTHAELQHVRGLMEFFYGVPLDGAAALVEGSQVIASIDPHKALQMLADAGQCAHIGGDVAVMRKAVRLAAALPIEASDPRAPLVAMMAGIASLISAVVPEADRPVVTDAAQRAPATSAHPLLAVIDQVAESSEPRWLMWAASVASAMGDPAREQSLGRRAESIARSSAAVGTLAIVLESLAFADVLAGRLRALATHAQEGLALATETGLTNSACYHRAMLAFGAAARGDEITCIDLADEVGATAVGRGLGLAQSVSQWALGLLDLGLGHPDEATPRLRSVATSPSSNIIVSRHVLPDLVEAAVHAGRPDVAVEAADRLTGQARPGAPEWVLAPATRCRALVTEDPLLRERLLGEAATQHERDQGSFGHARTLLLLGEHLRRERRRREARVPLQAALESFEHIGANPWAERARRELRATGQSVRRRHEASMDALTVQERQIAAIVADGATNKEAAAQLFLSPRTVEYHLRSVFSKLGISSRLELIRLGLDDREQRRPA